MLIKTQKVGSTVCFVNPDLICAWQIDNQDAENKPTTLTAITVYGLKIDMGTFENSTKAQNWLGRMQTGLTAGRQGIVVPSLTEQNIETERASWD